MYYFYYVNYLKKKSETKNFYGNVKSDTIHNFFIFNGSNFFICKKILLFKKKNSKFLRACSVYITRILMLRNNLSVGKNNKEIIHYVKTNGEILYTLCRAIKEVACYNGCINQKKYQKNFMKIKKLAHKLFYVLSPF